MRLYKSGWNKQDAVKRVIGEAEAFKSEPGVRVNEKEMKIGSFSNNEVIEIAMRGSSTAERSRRVWVGQLSRVGSMKDQRSVARRGITIGLEKRCLDLDEGEKIMAKKFTKVKGFNYELEGTGYEIERESLDHKCENDQDKEIEIENEVKPRNRLELLP
ncbi:hypothetical protein L1987_04318 [Smallanthus sonchifolius]|uniref:Uncharacterized protein n=1 Tax=Smallanthus sonchifolius TaxID=185202 RepID=A0ACB9KD97_9ASTR|nr:hypothetical protein L1987_04318 [Smallanthus sonchifolius]